MPNRTPKQQPASHAKDARCGAHAAEHDLITDSGIACHCYAMTA
ncbi:MAG: hypothetical protein ACLTGG_05645 [Subdoligranulum sp.]